MLMNTPVGTSLPFCPCFERFLEAFAGCTSRDYPEPWIEDSVESVGGGKRMLMLLCEG